MKKTLKVAVSQRVDAWEDRGECRDALDQRLTTFLLEAGFMPYPVPNNLVTSNTQGSWVHDYLNNWFLGIQPQAILLSGGNNIGDCPNRDVTEGWLLDQAQAQHLPVLGICRGMQRMAVWAGGKIAPLSGHVRVRHHLRSQSNKGKWPDEVNSFHEIALSNCPPGFEVMARSEDGAIEAVRHKTFAWEGWMWHPEREESFAEVDVNRLKALFNL